MDAEFITARLNLCAVLPNLQRLPELDSEAANLIEDWDQTIQFIVRRGPSAYVSFSDGSCTYGQGKHSSPTIKLYFLSPKHANKMFAGKGIPIPLKGFTKLGFLKRHFEKLTQRLEFFMKPASDVNQDDAFRKISVTLLLETALRAVRELATYEPTCKKVAAHTPKGALEVNVLPEGPCAHVIFGKTGVKVGRGPAEQPMARMSFAGMDTAYQLFNGKLDSFLAVACEKVLLNGQIPMIDNLGLILDRVERFLK